MTLQGKLKRLQTAIRKTRQRDAEIYQVQRQLDAELRKLAKRRKRHEDRAEALSLADAQMWVEIYMKKPDGRSVEELEDAEYR